MRKTMELFTEKSVAGDGVIANTKVIPVIITGYWWVGHCIGSRSTTKNQIPNTIHSILLLLQN